MSADSAGIPIAPEVPSEGVSDCAGIPAERVRRQRRNGVPCGGDGSDDFCCFPAGLDDGTGAFDTTQKHTHTYTHTYTRTEREREREREIDRLV